MLIELYQELLRDIKFITMKSLIYYNKKRSKGSSLKKGDSIYLLQKNIKIKRLSLKLDHTKLRPYNIKEVLKKVIYRL
jgi:uncharacterized Zn ribbon protein